jgi:hypothetical protein
MSERLGGACRLKPASRSIGETHGQGKLYVGNAPIVGRRHGAAGTVRRLGPARLALPRYKLVTPLALPGWSGVSYDRSIPRPRTARIPRKELAMNTSLVGLVKIGAVVFSATLAALFVYDRATGGAFYRRLTEPTATVDATPVATYETAPGPRPADEAGAPRILFSGSKSDSGHTMVAGGTLELQANSPGPTRPSVYAPGAYQGAPSDPGPPTILMSGSKSYLPTPGPALGPPPANANPAAAADSPPNQIFYTTKSGPIFYEPAPAQPAPPQPNVNPYDGSNGYSAPQVTPAPRSPYPNAPPYANSPAYVNVPLTPADAGGPSRPNAPPATSPTNPPRPSTIMMGTKSAAVFLPPTGQAAPQAGPTYPPPPYQGQTAGPPVGQPAYQPAANGKAQR